MKQILRALPVAMTFLVVRIVYALVSAYATNIQTRVWNLVSGSAILFACMALLPEYLIVGIFIYVGFKISPYKNVNEGGDDPQKYEDLEPTKM